MNKKMIKILEEQDKHFLYTFVFSIYKEYNKFQYSNKGDDYTLYKIKKDDIKIFKMCNDLYGKRGIYKFLNNKNFFTDNEVFLIVNNAYICSGLCYEGFYTLNIKKEVIMKAIVYFDNKSISRILKEEIPENTNKKRRL